MPAIRRRSVSRANLRSPPSSAVREIDGMEDACDGDVGVGVTSERSEKSRSRVTFARLENLVTKMDTGYKRAYIIPEALTLFVALSGQETRLLQVIFDSQVP